MKQMKSIIGTLNIVTNSGTIINGVSVNIAPTQSSKTLKGSGTDITGDHVMPFSFINATVTYGLNRMAESPIKVKRKASKYRSKLTGTDKKETKSSR